MRAVFWLPHRPIRHTSGRLLVIRKRWVAPPRRRLYHAIPSGSCRSEHKVLNLLRMVCGDARRMESPGHLLRQKFERACTIQTSSIVILSRAPKRWPDLDKGRDQTARLRFASKTKSPTRALNNSPVRAKRLNPKSIRTVMSCQPFSKARWAIAYAIKGVRGNALEGSSERLHPPWSLQLPINDLLQAGMKWPNPLIVSEA